MLLQAEEDDDVLEGGGNSSIPSTETVPDYWPDVPVIAVNRHPVFPKFIKIVELNDEKLVDTIRRKVKLNQPYVGIFVKKDDENTSEVVSSLEELYPTGTFAKVVELQNLVPRPEGADGPDGSQEDQDPGPHTGGVGASRHHQTQPGGGR